MTWFQKNRKLHELRTYLNFSDSKMIEDLILGFKPLARKKKTAAYLNWLLMPLGCKFHEFRDFCFLITTKLPSFQNNVWGDSVS